MQESDHTPPPDADAPESIVESAAEPTPEEAAPEQAPSQVTEKEVTEEALRIAEALIFAHAEPVSARALGQLLGPDEDADAVLAALQDRYAGRGVLPVQVAGGWQFRTASDLAPRLKKVVQQPRRLPRAAMETLAIVAYHQPVTRPEIEEIRGASLSQSTLDALLEAGLVAPKGRKEVPGRPTLWGTTPAFLLQFGLKDLRELPRREDLLVEPPTPAALPQIGPSSAGPSSEETPPEEKPAEEAPSGAPESGVVSTQEVSC